jgi:two-component system chemotaxis sensor kinase CheA
VALESRAGEGARVRLILPFTVMMTRLLVVEAGGQRFGIPLDAVLETVRVPRERLSQVGQARAFVHRQRTLPLIRLAEALGAGQADAERGEADVVVATAGGHTAGLEVARVGERIEAMLKPLGGLMAAAPGLAGATLLGDGQVLLVLDVQELLL